MAGLTTAKAVTGRMHQSSQENSKDGRGVVRLSRHDVQELRRLLLLLSPAAERNIIVKASADIEAPADAEPRGRESRAVLVQKARDMLDNRRSRIEQFGKTMFREPAWDTLLELYADNGPRQSITRLANAAGCSKTTLLRWLDYLERQQLIRREEHPNDRRKTFVALTDKGRDRLDLYFSQVVGIAG